MTDATPMKAVGKYRWTICALLFFGTTINYLDRQVLSLLHPILEEELGWTNADYGLITAFFQLTYGLSTIFAGRLIDKIGTKKGYSIALIIWSIGAILHAAAIEIGEATADVFGFLGIAGISASVLGFIIARMVLAIGESANFPAAIKATAEYFPMKERSLATGIFNSGSNIGAILAPLTVPWLAYKMGWQSTFIIIGSLGFIWLFFWWRYYEIPTKQKRLSTGEYDYINSEEGVSAALIEANQSGTKMSWIKLLGLRQTWAFTLGKFFTDGVWWFLLFWLPSYLTTQFDLTTTEITLPLAVLYSMTMVGSISGGWFPMFFIKRGFTTPIARRKAMLLIAIVPLAVLLVQPLGKYTVWIPVFLIGLCASAHQAWSANLYSSVSDMFPKSAVASVIGIGTMAGSIGGALTSYFVGQLLDFYKITDSIETGYTIVFCICAFSYLFAWYVIKLLVPKLTQL